MADYGYESGGYAGKGENWGATLGQALARIGIEHRKKQAMLDTVQGYLNVAKGITTTDPKNPGKPKPFFTAEQLSTVQNLVNQGKAYQAGSAASALGIGKNLLQRTASANQSASGPTTVVKDGVTFRQTHTGDWVPMNAPPRDEKGMTPTQQAQVQAQQGRAFAAQQAGLDKELKTVGLNRSLIFDDNQQQLGKVIGGRFWQLNNQTGNYEFTDAPGHVESVPAAKVGDPTDVRVGFVPPVFSQQIVKDNQGQANLQTIKESAGKQGTIVPYSQMQAYQDTAASAAGPQAAGALQWIRNPNNSEDPRLPAMNVKLQSLVTQAGARVVQTQPTAADTSEDTQQEPNAEPPADKPDTVDEEP